MPRVLVLNGPNLGRLGSREPDVYGDQDLSALRVLLAERAGADYEIDLRQTDDEAELIHWLHEAVDARERRHPESRGVHALQLRAARRRALVTKAGLPLVEVHISNPHAREEFRHTSVISGVATGVIAGFGFDSYVLAFEAVQRLA